MNDAIKALTSPGADLNEIIERQAKQQTGIVNNIRNEHNNANEANQSRGKVLQKSRSSISKRHK